MENRRRAQELLKKMTLTEKVGQLASKPFGFAAYARDEAGEIVLTEEFKSYVLRFGGKVRAERNSQDYVGPFHLCVHPLP